MDTKLKVGEQRFISDSLDDKRKYELMENIGQKYNNEKYLEIKRELKRANNVTVWIKTKEQNFYKPKIFKIQADDKTVLTLNDVKTEYNWIFIFLMIIGFGSVGFVFKRKYPEKYQKLINKKPTANKSYM